MLHAGPRAPPQPAYEAQRGGAQWGCPPFLWKPSQMTRGSKLYFQIHTAEQTGSPVSTEKQQAVLQELRKYAAQFGVTIEERPRYRRAP